MADEVKELYKQLGFQGYRKYLKLLENDYIINFTITLDDVKTGTIYLWSRYIVVKKENDNN